MVGFMTAGSGWSVKRIACGVVSVAGMTGTRSRSAEEEEEASAAYEGRKAKSIVEVSLLAFSTREVLMCLSDGLGGGVVDEGRRTAGSGVVRVVEE